MERDSGATLVGKAIDQPATAASQVIFPKTPVVVQFEK
jgi:hypothetical protein